MNDWTKRDAYIDAIDPKLFPPNAQSAIRVLKLWRRALLRLPAPK